jgi:uncharacterized membrane protein YdbT with pleckstrin-like domain
MDRRSNLANPMYNAFRLGCEHILRIPHDPEPPPGDEASTRTFRAAPNYYKYLLAIWGIRALGSLFIPCVALAPALIGLGMSSRRSSQVGFVIVLVLTIVVIGFLIVLNLFGFAVLKLEYEKRWYMVTDRSLRIREGVVFVREMTVNFANIQNISISQGPIQRVLGIADLRVDTAGGGGGSAGNQTGQNLHTAWFRGIDNANDVRQLIQARLQHLKDSGLGDPDDRHPPASEGRSSHAELAGPLREVLAEIVGLRRALAEEKR